MYLVAIGWLYVVVLMAVAEGLSPQGTWLGAAFTFLLYGLLPVSVVIYIMGAPIRRKARLKQEAQEWAEHQAKQAPKQTHDDHPADPTLNSPDASGHPPGTAEAHGVSSVREKP